MMCFAFQKPDQPIPKRRWIFCTQKHGRSLGTHRVGNVVAGSFCVLLRALMESPRDVLACDRLVRRGGDDFRLEVLVASTQYGLWRKYKHFCHSFGSSLLSRRGYNASRSSAALRSVQAETLTSQSSKKVPNIHGLVDGVSMMECP